MSENNKQIPFRKMNGLGNDFVVLDARRQGLPLSADKIRSIADRDGGVGCDQLIVMEPAKENSDAALFMRIYNHDGGEVDACGNATRCIATLIANETGRSQSAIDTNAGRLGTVVNADGSVTVDMGEPRLKWDEIPLRDPFHDTRRIELQVGPIDNPVLHTPSVVNVGNPHCIFWVDDVMAHDLDAIGPVLENHPLFPERANISLAHITAADAITLRVWERGVGLTKACGTAACAVVVAGVRLRRTERLITVTLPGGQLLMEWRESDNHIYMTGPVALEYEGTLDLA